MLMGGFLVQNTLSYSRFLTDGTPVSIKPMVLYCRNLPRRYRTRRNFPCLWFCWISLHITTIRTTSVFNLFYFTKPASKLVYPKIVITLISALLFSNIVRLYNRTKFAQWLEHYPSHYGNRKFFLWNQIYLRYNSGLSRFVFTHHCVRLPGSSLQCKTTGVTRIKSFIVYTMTLSRDIL